MARRSRTTLTQSSGMSIRGRMSDVRVLITSIVASLLLLASMVGVLFAFDGKPIFDNGILTLNTVIAILSAANKATILYAVSHAIGQWKWIAFSGREQRRLLDFERIESASRGPLGSLGLLTNTRVRRVLVIRGGALLAVLAVAMDPFAQQILQYRVVPIRIRHRRFWDETTVAQATRYSRGTETRLAAPALMLTEGNSTSLSAGITATTAHADFGMQSAIMYGILQPLDAVTQQVRFNCSTGNCFFPEFRSLSVCSACNNLASRLDISQVPDSTRLNISLDVTSPGATATDTTIRRYSLPGSAGLYIDTSVRLTMSGTANLSQSPSFASDPRGAAGLIWAQTVLQHHYHLLAEGDDFDTVGATECMLYYCVKSYNSSVVNGTLRETSADTGAGRVPGSWAILPDGQGRDLTASLAPRRAASLAFHPRFSYLRREDLQFEGGYNISQAAVDGVSSFFQQTFATCLRGMTNCTEDLEAVAENWRPMNGYFMVEELADSIWEGQTQYEPSVAQALWSVSNLTAVFESVAASMGNALRNGADPPENQTTLENNSVVTGDRQVSVTTYAVDVRWSLLHWIVELGGILFVAWTLYKSWGGGGASQRREIPLWGSSTLAVLSRGPQVAGVFSGAATLEDMEARARAAKVVLADGQTVAHIEGEVGLDEFMMVEGEGGKFLVQPHQTGQGAYAEHVYGQGKSQESVFDASS